MIYIQACAVKRALNAAEWLGKAPVLASSKALNKGTRGILLPRGQPSAAIGWTVPTISSATAGNEVFDNRDSRAAEAGRLPAHFSSDYVLATTRLQANGKAAPRAPGIPVPTLALIPATSRGGVDAGALPMTRSPAATAVGAEGDCDYLLPSTTVPLLVFGLRTTVNSGANVFQMPVK